jgi:hypothetical protein
MYGWIREQLFFISLPLDVELRGKEKKKLMLTLPESKTINNYCFDYQTGIACCKHPLPWMSNVGEMESPLLFIAMAIYYYEPGKNDLQL